MAGGVEFSWGAIVGFAVFVSVVGPGFYWLGRTSKQVDVNTKDITLIFTKLDDIHKFVKRNGHSP